MPHHKDVALSCLYLFLVQKNHCLIKHLIQDPSNHDIINSFLRVAKTTNTDHRKSFLIAMRQLLKTDHTKQVVDEEEIATQQRLSDIYMMIFSNIMTPANFPSQFGLLDQSVEWLVNIASTPYEKEEMACLKLTKQLVKHQWGCKAYF